MEIVRSVTNGSRASARWFLPALLAVLGFAGIAAAMAQGGEEAEGLAPGFEAHTFELAPNDGPLVTGATIFWPDERIPVPDTTEAPWRSVVWLLTAYPNGDIGTCTGSLVSPTTILTAAHCVFSDEHGFPSGVLAIPGADGDAEGDWPYGTHTVLGDRVTIPVGWSDSTGEALVDRVPFDFALVHVDAPPWGNQTGPYLTLAAATDEMFNDSNSLIASAGYPSDKAGGTMWFSAGFPAFLDEFVIRTRMDAFPGQSGSPIYLFNEVDAYVVTVGVYSAETIDYNIAVRLSPLHINTLRNWCDELGCTFDSVIAGEETQATPTNTPIPQATATNTPIPQATATNTPVPQATATPTDIPVAQPTETVPPPPGGDQPFEQLHFRWSLVPWMQDDAPIGEVLAAAGLSDIVTAIYTWRAETQGWEAYFPAAAGIPGANDFETFEHGTGYWIAISEPVDLPAPTPTTTPPPEETATPTSTPPAASPTATSTVPPPTPTNTPPAPTATPTSPAGQHSYSGSGESVVDTGTLPAGNWWVDLTHNGQSNFIVWAHPADGFQELLVNEIGNYDGRRWLEGGTSYLVDIDADGAWTLQLTPMGNQQGANTSISGSGDTVTGLFTPSPGGAGSWTFTHTGQANFIVWLECDTTWDLAQNVIGPANNTTVINFGTASECFWDIQADGNWTITRN